MMQARVKPLHKKVTLASEHLSEVKEKLASMDGKLKVSNHIRLLGVNLV